MPTLVFSCPGGSVVVPDTVLCDRRDGGHLVVEPPHPVWERSCLEAPDLMRWSLLVAATGRTMLDALPALSGGCLNYWEAGNWALNAAAEPVGEKRVEAHRRVHLHIFGRSRGAIDADWRWGESPKFPDFVEAKAWASRFAPLSNDECRRIAEGLETLLAGRFRFPDHFPECAG